jgi:uncharacterized C2H2 Zn-finger protein
MDNYNKCKDCGKLFKNLYNYNKHINKKFPCNSIFKCDICNKIFKTSDGFNKHKKKVFSCNKQNINELNIEIEKLKLKFEENEKNRKHDIEVLGMKTSMLNEKYEKIYKVELLRTNRKERTVLCINDEILIKKSQNDILYEEKCIEHIKNTYINCVDFKEAFDKLEDKLCNDPSLTIDMIKLFRSDEDIINMILEEAFPNERKFPILYEKNINKFYTISYFNDKSNVEEIKNINKIFSKIEQYIQHILVMLLSISAFPATTTLYGAKKDHYNIKSGQIAELVKNLHKIDFYKIISKVFTIKIPQQIE